MTTIVKTINPVTKAIEQTKMDSVTAPLNIASGAIVEIQAGRAQIASFIQNGKNLVLVMVDGSEIVLQGYFDNAEGAVKKLILTEENGSVEVQFPTVDGSAAEGAPVDAAPSYAAVDADTAASLAGSGAAAASSGVSPVLLGVLGAAGIAAVAGGGGGGGDSAAPATQTEQQVVPKTEPDTKPEADPETKPETDPETQPETDPETKPETDPETQPEIDPDTKPETDPETQPETDPDTKPETDPDAKDISPANLVAKIKELSATVLASQDASSSDVEQVASAQKELLGLQQVVAEKIAGFDQSAAADDGQIKVELQALNGMLGRFSSALENEEAQYKTVLEGKEVLRAKMGDLEHAENLLDPTKAETDFNDGKADFKAKIETIENDDLKGKLVDLINAADTLESAKALQENIQAELQANELDTDNGEIAASFKKFSRLANSIDDFLKRTSGLEENVADAQKALDAADKNLIDSMAQFKAAEKASLDSLSPAKLLNEIDSLKDANNVFAKDIEQANEDLSVAKNNAADAEVKFVEASKYYDTFFSRFSIGASAALKDKNDAETTYNKAQKDVTDAQQTVDKLTADIESNTNQIGEHENTLGLELLTEIDSLNQILDDLDNKDFNELQSLTQKTADDAMKIATELQEAKEAKDIASEEFHATTGSWGLGKGDSAKFAVLELAKKELTIAEERDVQVKKDMILAKEVADDLNSAVKSISEQIAQKEAELHAKTTPAEKGAADSVNESIVETPQADQPSQPVDNDIAKELFFDNAEVVAAPVSAEADSATAVAMQDDFAAQPQVIMQ